MRARAALDLLRQTYNQWSEAKAERLGAALAFYTVISLAPLLVLVLAAAGFVFGPQAAAGQVAGELESTFGRPVARALEGMIREAHRPWSGVVATTLSLAVLLFGASGVFAALQDAMNTIWQVTPRPGRGILGVIKDRFLSFALILGSCLLLLTSLVATATLAAVGRAWTPHGLPGSAHLWQGVNAAVAFGVVTLLFAMIFKILPDARVRWADVWVGAAATALLFTAGKYLLGVYLLAGGVTLGYGAAGSLVVVLLWVYYSSQIVLFGATFTRVYACRYGAGVRPAANAVLLSAEDRARQGIPTEGQARQLAQPQGVNPADPTPDGCAPAPTSR
jgi:membrane protein